jgi:hypothetical protein
MYIPNSKGIGNQALNFIEPTIVSPMEPNQAALKSVRAPWNMNNPYSLRFPLHSMRRKPVLKSWQMKTISVM